MTQPPPELRALVRGLHHVAIAVRGIDENRYLYEGLMGLVPREVEHVPEQKVNTMVYDADGQRIELVEPAAEDAPITRFLTERSGGIHHLAWRVADIEEAHRRCMELGLEVLGDGPGPGAHGTRVFFLHPRDTRHVLHEFVEDPAVDEGGAKI